MTEYHMYGLILTERQANMIVSAAKKHTAITIRLVYNNLQGKHTLLLTQIQISQINKTRKIKKGIDLKLFATQLEHLEKSGHYSCHYLLYYH